MTEYHHTGTAEPETAKATFTQTVLEIFAGEEVIENGGLDIMCVKTDDTTHVETNIIYKFYFTTTASTGQTCRQASHLIHNSVLITCFS